MVVFFPFYRPKNNFLGEIEPYFEGTFLFDSYFNIHLYPKIDIIHIHWPEILFNWEKLSTNKLNEFKSCFVEWKKKYRIFYTRHNIYPHNNTSSNYIKLYDFICNNVDAVIHLGNYSIKEFKNHYPKSNAKHIFIEHPLYLKKPNTISKKEAKLYFGIKEEQKVILVFGQIRNKEERVLIFSAFNKLNIKNKMLLISRMKKFRLPSFFGTKLNYNYNKLMFKWYNNKPSYIINNKFVEESFVQYYFKAADTVLIPRIKLLNSGNLYLAYTFNKNVVTPLIGNISEKLDKIDNDSYNPNNISSLVLALKSSIEKNDVSKNYKNALKTMNPEMIAENHLNFYKKIKVNQYK